MGPRIFASAVLILSTSLLSAADSYPVSSVRYEGVPAGAVSALTDGNEFLALFGEHAARISPNGQMLDAVPFRTRLPGNASEMTGVWTGNAYLIARKSYEYPQIRIAVGRIDRHGNSVGSISHIDRDAAPLAFIRTGSNFLLISWIGHLFADLFDAAGNQVRSGVLPLDSRASSVAATAIQSGALIVTAEPGGSPYRIRARVVSEAGEVILDSIVSRDAFVGSSVHLADTPAGALLVWNTRDYLRIATFDGNGAVVDQLPFEIEPANSVVKDVLRVREGVLVYGSRPGDGSPGTILLASDGTILRPWIVATDFFETIASNGDSALAFQQLGGRGLSARAMSADGSMGEIRDFPSVPSAQTMPSIACGGADCVVVWSEANRDGSYSIRANALDQNGRPVRPESIEISNAPGYNPVVARSADRYLVVWQRTDDVYFGDSVIGRRLTPGAEPLDSAPFVIDEDYGGVPAVASDGKDFLVVRARYTGEVPREFVTGFRVDADGTVGPARIISDPADYVSGFASLSWAGDNYLVAYGDNAPCQITCPPRDVHVWLRPVSRDGDALGARVTIAADPGIAYPVIGSTATSTTVAWWSAGHHEAARVNADGAPQGGAFRLPFDVYEGRALTADAGRVYFPVRIAGSDRGGFLALSEQGSAIAMPIGGTALPGGVIAIGVEGSGRPRLVISESSSLGIERLLVHPAEMRAPQANLAVRIDDVPGDVHNASGAEAIVAIQNVEGTPATGVVARIDPATVLDDDGGVCTSNYLGVTCEWPQIDARDSRRLRVRFSAPNLPAAPLEIEVRASVACREVDPDASDNSTARTLTILPAARSRALRR